MIINSVRFRFRPKVINAYHFAKTMHAGQVDNGDTGKRASGHGADSSTVEWAMFVRAKIGKATRDVTGFVFARSTD